MSALEECGEREMQSVTEEQDKQIDGPAISGRGDRSSTRMSGRIGRWAFHPVFLGIFPILALFAQNAGQVRLSDPIRVVAGALLGTALIWFLASVALKDARKAALVASAAVVLFFSFDFIVRWVEQVISIISQYWVKRLVVLRPGVVLLPELVLLGFLVYVLIRRVRAVRVVTAFLNVFSVVLLLVPVYQIISIKSPTAARPPRVAERFAISPQPGSSPLPDIYYIILDGYARGDVMKSLFDFDNSSFLADLEDRGFYVARQSTSNYCQTPLSLSASLNGVYLDELVKGLGPDQTELSDLIGKSNVVATLKPMGYKFVTFATGFDPTEHPEADVYLSPQRYWNGFERMVIDATWLRVIWPNPEQLDPATRSRRRTFFLLDQLPKVARIQAPTFTLAHVFCPHPPFIFGENGEDVSALYRKYSEYAMNAGEKSSGRFRDPASFCAGYRGQSVFITRRIQETIDRLLADSETPPIIILQSDHGSELNLDMHDIRNTDLKERMSILNAYYFPGRRYDPLYPQVTPVNSFRIVLNSYFGANLELLPDRSFFSTWPEPYLFHDVTEAVRAGSH
jgi:hypothetical protein